MTKNVCECDKRISSHTYEQMKNCLSNLSQKEEKKFESEYVEAYLIDSMVTQREIQEEV